MLVMIMKLNVAKSKYLDERNRMCTNKETDLTYQGSNGNLTLLTRLLMIVALSQYMGWGCLR